MSLIAISSRIYTMAKKAALIYEVLDRVSRDEQLTREPWNTMPTYEISEENTKKGIDFAKMCFKNSEYLYLRLRSTDVMVKLEKFKDVIKPPYSGAMVVATPEGNKEPVYAILKSDMMRHLGMKLRDFNDYFNTFVEMKRFATATVKTKTKKGTIVFSEVPKDADETAKWVAAGLKYKQSKKKQKHPN